MSLSFLTVPIRQGNHLRNVCTCLHYNSSWGEGSYVSGMIWRELGVYLMNELSQVLWICIRIPFLIWLDVHQIAKYVMCNHLSSPVDFGAATSIFSMCFAALSSETVAELYLYCYCYILLSLQIFRILLASGTGDVLQRTMDPSSPLDPCEPSWKTAKVTPPGAKPLSVKKR